MNISQGVKSRLGGIGKGAVKQVIREPVEVLKTVGEQTVGARIPQTEKSYQTQPPQREAKPSIEQEKLPRRLAGYKNELEELIARQRQEREQKVQQARMMEEKKEEEKEQEEKTNKESRFQKTLRLVTRRAKARFETRLPKAA